MKRKLYYIAFLLLACTNLHAQQADSLFVYNDSLHFKKRFFRAALETFSVNAGVWAFDRYVKKEDYAKISIGTIKDNIKKGFVWDNNEFSSNMLQHPIQGRCYYSSARSNGFNFWQSSLFTLAGSLSWEFCAEKTPPSTNDVLTTTFAGAALGEITYRLSSMIYDDSKRGANRFFREFLGTVISPVREINRLMTGDAWKVKHKYYIYHDYDQLPVKFTLTIGDRYMSDNAHMFKGENSVYTEFKMIYGDPFKKTKNTPYDYFRFSTVINLGQSQPRISSINLNAKLCGKYFQPLPGHKAFVGLFQHFDYFNSKIVTDNSKHIPFKMAEAAAVGPGIIYMFPVSKNITIRHSSYYNIVLLGASLTDYYRLGRDYNLGSGFSIKSYTNIDFGKYGNFELYIHDYHLFTWKGYTSEEIKNTDSPYFNLNTQGDKGNAQLIILNPVIGQNLSSCIYTNLGLYYYFRKTHYDASESNVFSRTFEVRLGLRYTF